MAADPPPLTVPSLECDVGDERTGRDGGESGWGAPPPPPAGGGPSQGAWQQPQPSPGWQQPPPGATPPGPGGWQQPPPGGWPPPAVPPRQSTNGVAIAALVCGLLALPLTIFLVGGFVGLVAVILGIVGLSRAATVGTGRGMAVTGIVAGGLSVVLTAGLIFVGVQVWRDPDFQELLEEEMRRQEQLLEDQDQQQP